MRYSADEYYDIMGQNAIILGDCSGSYGFGSSHEACACINHALNDIAVHFGDILEERKSFLLAGVKCEDVDDDQQKDMVSKIHSLQSELALKEMDGLFLRIGRAVLKGLECLAGAGEVGIRDSDLDLSWEDYKCVFEDRESFNKTITVTVLVLVSVYSVLISEKDVWQEIENTFPPIASDESRSFILGRVAKMLHGHSHLFGGRFDVF